jgi:hypothetical protein
MKQTPFGEPDEPTPEEVDRALELSELHPDARAAHFGPASVATHRLFQQHMLDRGQEE